MSGRSGKRVLNEILFLNEAATPFALNVNGADTTLDNGAYRKIKNDGCLDI